jgi:ribosomal protein S6
MIKEYETIFVLEPNFDEGAVENEIEKIKEIVTANGGEVVAVEKWVGASWPTRSARRRKGSTA